MEPSFLASWQFENFSTAELSPPVSPVSPNSPLFYDGSNPSSPSASIKAGNYVNNTSKMAGQQQSQKPAVRSVLSSRAQAATNMLNELERLHSVEHQNAFGMSQYEESVDLNMDLFEELQDIEFTPPLFSSSEDYVPTMKVESVEVPSVAVSSPLPVVPQSVVAIPSNDNARLAVEFKSILESLNTANRISINSGNTTTINNSSQGHCYGSLLQAAGIPTTTVVCDECLVPVEFIGRPSATGSIGEEPESMDLDGIIISDDLTLVNESDLFSLSAELALEENSNGSIVNSNATLVNGVLPYWAKDMMVPVDDLDNQLDMNVNALDALLKGDVYAARNAISSGYSSQLPIKQAFSPISVYSSDEDDSILVEDTISPVEVIQPQPVVEEKKKPERRGRKPAKYNKQLKSIKDKSLRKKEQNKTAATRYRQKKKEELAVTLAEEDELQEVHDELEKQKLKLGSEISVIRSLLRDMLADRKQRKAPATASSLVQGRRVGRNRK